MTYTHENSLRSGLGGVRRVTRPHQSFQPFVPPSGSQMHVNLLAACGLWRSQEGKGTPSMKLLGMTISAEVGVFGDSAVLEVTQVPVSELCELIGAPS